MASTGGKPAGSKRGLLGLPPELLSHILSFVNVPTEKADVCTVCKQLQAVMLPLLYHDVHLVLRNLRNANPTVAIGAFFRSTDPGLGLIRHLTVDIFDKGLDTGHPNVWLRSGSDDDLMRLLARQQRALETIRVDCLTVHNFFGQDDHFRRSFKGVKHISCMVDEAIDPFQANPSAFAMCSAPFLELQTLEVSLAYLEFEPEKEATGEEMNMTTAALFQRFLPATRARPADSPDAVSVSAESPFSALRTLRLSDVGFGGPTARVLCQVFDISGLKSLNLHSCYGVAPLLHAMTIAGKLSLEQLVILTDDIGTTPAMSTAELLDTLIGGFTGLRTLVLYIKDPRGAVPLPSVNAVAQHASSLKILSLELGDEAGGRYEIDHLRVLGRTCVKLEQLSLVFAPVALRGYASPCQDSDAVRDAEDSSYHFWESMEAISALPRLRTLHIRRLPETSVMRCNADEAEGDERNLGYTMYSHEMLSTNCWRDFFHNKPLKVLAWGHQGSGFVPTEHWYVPAPHTQDPGCPPHQCDRWRGMRCFFRGELLDLRGRKRITAIYRGDEAKYYEPAMEVLQTWDPMRGFPRF